MQYYTMTTDAGDSAVAKAIQSGSMVTFTKMSVGDGNGTYYEPAKTQTTLRNEVWSGTPTVLMDKNNPKRVTATISIPADAGPFVVREAGLFSADGVLLVVAKVPLMEKVSPESGASDDLTMRIYVEVSDASVVTVVVDPSQIDATKKDVDDAKAEVQTEVDEHKADTVAHMTQEQKDQLAAAVPNSRKINGHALTGDVTVTKSDLGLGNVDNTADANKFVNYANSAGSAPANGGTSSDTQTVSSALTMVSGGTEPSGTLSPGKLWAGY
ncbi:Phage tail-collar fiber protein [Caprobacter fermentans]|uniref:Phage tail-collar fiber protein n=1 Tax=Caproicibacter fermentans TaxID=2576756 RepID=A0A6N8HZJ2_9FIRM|nr:phage tail protein [Caproicibacter fermentans]MVB11088.1 Phage tail-collar fiber protein [Caproicibacter fermentans]